MRPHTLGSFLYAQAVVALAVPQEIIPVFPISNSTSTSPTPTNTACAINCSVQYPALTGVQWIPESQITFTEKVTVATLSVIYTTLGDFTAPPRTEIVYNSVGPEYSLYHVGADDQGTQVLTIPLTLSDGSTTAAVITYPTPHIDYSTEYQWQGVLQTHNTKFEPSCATAAPDPAKVSLARHPEYPKPSKVPTPGENDPFGYEHRPLWVPIQDEPNTSFFDQAFPSESALALCKSVQATPPVPTLFSAPKYVTVYTTIWTTPPVASAPHVESTASGFETSKCCRHTPAVPHIQSTVSGFETSAPTTTRKPAVRPSVTTEVAHVESTVAGFDGRPRPPLEQNTDNPGSPGGDMPPSLPDLLISVINQNPSIFSSAVQNQQAAPTPQPAPVFTYIPTVVNGQATSIPAFLLPAFSTTATIGQTVTVNGQTTVLSIPGAVFTALPTTINGVPTSLSAYIISGTSTASVGQTVVLDGTTTVLSIPSSTSEGSGVPGRPQDLGSPEDFEGLGHSSSSASRSTILLAIVFGAIIWL